MPVVIAPENQAANLVAGGDVHLVDLFRENVSQYVVPNRNSSRQLAFVFLVNEYEFSVEFRADECQIEWRANAIIGDRRNDKSLFNI